METRWKTLPTALPEGALVVVGSHSLYFSALLYGLVQITLCYCFRYVASTHLHRGNLTPPPTSPLPQQVLILPHKSDHPQPFLGVFVPGPRPAIQRWWGAASHKEAELRLLVHPSPPITQATETDEILSPLYWFLCIAVFFLCPSRPPNPIGGVLVLQRSREDSLYPVMPLTLNKSSRVVRKGFTWKRAAGTLLWNVLEAQCFISYWKYLCADSKKCISQTDLLLS